MLVAGGGGGPHHHRAARPGAVLGWGPAAGGRRARLAGEALQLGLQRRLVTATARICNTRGYISFSLQCTIAHTERFGGQKMNLCEIIG